MPVRRLAGALAREIFIDGQPVSISNCQQAIAHGIAMVPEDRKKTASCR